MVVQTVRQHFILPVQRICLQELQMAHSAPAGLNKVV